MPIRSAVHCRSDRQSAADLLVLVRPVKNCTISGTICQGGMGAPRAPMIQQAGRGEQQRTVRTMPGARRPLTSAAAAPLSDHRAPRAASDLPGHNPEPTTPPARRRSAQRGHGSDTRELPAISPTPPLPYDHRSREAVALPGAQLTAAAAHLVQLPAAARGLVRRIAPCISPPQAARARQKAFHKGIRH